MQTFILRIALLVAGCGAPHEPTHRDSGSLDSLPGDTRGVDTGCRPVEESCDGLDNDCDGGIDEGVTILAYPDVDGDGAGDPSSPTATCEIPAGWSSEANDCNDADPSAYPGAPEICDGADNDCDDTTDEGFDADGDGALSAALCVDGTDCDDADPAVGPGQTDVAGDGRDTDCDGCDDDCRWLGDLTAEDASARFLGDVAEILGIGLAAGDINDDGFDDLLIAAHGKAPGGGAYAVFMPDVVDRDLATEADLVIEAGSYANGAGRAMDIGDASGDGVADVLIGAPYGGEGHVAGSGFLLRGPLSGVVDLASADAWFDGEGDTCDFVGHGLALGDQDGDGVEDVSIGAYRDDYGATDGGAVYVWNGPVRDSHSVVDADAVLYSTSVDARAGSRTWIGGDLDGDGIDDHQVSLLNESSGAPQSGTLAVFHGPVAGVLNLADADARLLGEVYLSMAGWATGTGDADGDGLDDLATSACWGGPGYAFLLYSPFSGTIRLGDSDVVFGGVSGRVGQGLSVGDVDHDGLADVAIGAPSEADVGYVHLNYGPISGNVDLLTSDANFTGNRGSYSGIDLVIHDFNEDDRGDLAITAYYEGAVDLYWNGS